MSAKLFVITNYDGGIYGIFIDFEKAKEKLHDIYKKTPDFKYYGYKINEYCLCRGERGTTHPYENIFGETNINNSHHINTVTNNAICKQCLSFYL